MSEPQLKKQIEYADRQPTLADLEFLRRLPLTNDEILELIKDIPDRPVLKRELTITDEKSVEVSEIQPLTQV
jgi:hypothetical protein